MNAHILYSAVGFPNLYSNHHGGNIKFNSFNDIPLLIANLIQVVLFLGAAMAVIFIVVAGIKYSTAQGDASKVQSAKGTITNAILGLVISAGAYLIVDALAAGLGGSI